MPYSVSKESTRIFLYFLSSLLFFFPNQLSPKKLYLWKAWCSFLPISTLFQELCCAKRFSSILLFFFFFPGSFRFSPLIPRLWCVSPCTPQPFRLVFPLPVVFLFSLTCLLRFFYVREGKRLSDFFSRYCSPLFACFCFFVFLLSNLFFFFDFLPPVSRALTQSVVLFFFFSFSLSSFL